MKTRFIYYIVAAMMTLSACSLSTLPTDRFLQDSFWQNEDQVNAGLTGCYQILWDTYLYGGTATALFNDVVTPNQYMYDNTYGFGIIGKGAHDLANSDVINNRWGSCYKGIGRCNTFLDKVEPFKMDEARKKSMIGQAKFLRALYYSVLVDYYGDAPLILETPDVNKHSTLPRDPKSKVVDQIIKDLTEAAEDLPVAAAEPGRATKGASLALKARVELYNEKWADAVASAKAVIALNKYTLQPNYKRIFARDNENNSEVIFDVQFLFPNYKAGFDLITRQYITHAPLLDLCEAYQMSDGSDYVKGTPLAEGRDPRFYATISYPGATFMGKTVDDSRFASGRTLCTALKFSYYDEAFAPQYDYDDINYIVIRYADVLLMLAEASNEVSGPSDEVYDALNQIRDRVGMPIYDKAKGLSKEQLRDVIRKERRIELACEGLYYSDIRRWKIAHEVMNGEIYNWYGQRIETREFDKDRDYLWPIPENELKENRNLVQNPGWDK